VATRSAERPPRHLAAGASINVAAQVATIAAAGITSVAVARLLGPSGTGTLALAVTLVAVSTTLFSLGLRSGVIYRVSRGNWAPRAAARAAVASALVLGTIGGILGLGFYALTSGSVLEGLSPTMAIVTFASLPFALAWLFIASVALAVERYEAYGAITVVQPIAQVVLAVTLAATIGTLGAVLGFAISQVVAAGAAAVLFRRREAGSPAPRRPGELRAATRFGLLSWGSEVLQNLNYRLDLFVLNAFGVTADVGVYSVALTVTSFAWILPSALQTVLFPRTARLDTGDEPADGALTDVELAASRGTRQTVLLLIPTAAVLVFTLLVLVPLLYGPSFHRTIELGLILVPGTLALGLARVLVAVTAGRGHPQYSLYGRLIDMPITAVLYFVLIPAHGATGAAVASSVSYALTGVISFVFFRRVVHLPLRTLLVPTREDLRDWRSAARLARRRFSRGGPAR
jgi:O-antigen/teichoic acid export membrane protein